MKKIAVLLTATVLLSMLTGCQKPNVPTPPAGETPATETQSQESVPDVELSATATDMFTDRDRRTQYEEDSAVKIQLDGTTATASSETVKISGSTVTITEEATYLISGTLEGMLIVNAGEKAKLQLVFDGASINSATSAALYILEADKVFVTLAEGTENTLTNGGSFTAIDENNIDGALFSKQDLTVNGAGALTVTSPAGHGIVCKDDMVFTGGSVTVNAASHGIDANDSVRITDAALTIDAGKDAIHAENTDDTSLGFFYMASGSVKAEAEGDGISAGAYVQVEGGTVEVLAGGGSVNGTKQSSDSFGGFMGGGKGGGMGGDRPGEFGSTQTEEDTGTSMKGIKSGSTMLLSGGSFKVNSADDAIHSNASATVSGGTFHLTTGDDAIHAENTLTVTAGTVEITESYEGLEALHIDVQGGDIKLVAQDDGLNAAGGTDQSGFTGGRDGMFGGDKPGRGGGGGMGGGMSANSNGSIKLSGGKLYINASGDGIDANGTLEISGGYTVVVGPTRGDTATLDYDKSAVITGGTFLGTGASGMAQTFSDAKQGLISISVGNQSAGTQITIKDSAAKEIASYTPELDFAVLIFSSPEIVSGQTYTITVGSQSGEIQAN